MNNFDRAIDDPGLNQDTDFDKKDNEHFDETHEFNRHEDTSKDDKKEDKSATDNQPADDYGKFDGETAI